MDKVYQVFVSSTYSDLKNERQQVADTLAKAGFIPQGMELFPAADQDQLEFIERVIDRCDYYVVIVGGRYGSLADDNVSFTEKEYEYALSKRIPVLAFLHAEPDNIPVAKSDTEPTKAAKLKAFRDRLATGRLVRTWKTVDDLRTEVIISISQESNRRPGIGWVRGDQAIDPKVLQEMERLRIENADLKKRLADMDSDEISFPAQLAGPEEPFNFTIIVQNEKGSEVHRELIAAPIEQVFSNLFETLLRSPPESEIRQYIAQILIFNSTSHNFDFKLQYNILDTDIEQLRFHLEALGLIKAVLPDTTYTFLAVPFSIQMNWTITDKGRRYVVRKRAIRRGGRGGGRLHLSG